MALACVAHVRANGFNPKETPMRIVPVITAAAIGLAATLNFANAQSTTTAPQSGAAPTMANSTTDNKIDKMDKKAMKTSKKMKKDKKMKSSM